MKNIKSVSQYDNVTGELLDGVLAYCRPKHNPYGGGWLMNSQKALEILATDKNLTGEMLRVFLFLCSKSDFNNWIQVTQLEICNKLDLQKSNVSRAIKQLVNKNIILRGKKVGRSFEYRLNPDYGWKGDVMDLNEYRKEIEHKEQLEFKEKNLKSYQNQVNKEDK